MDAVALCLFIISMFVSSAIGRHILGKSARGSTWLGLGFGKDELIVGGVWCVTVGVMNLAISLVVIILALLTIFIAVMSTTLGIGMGVIAMVIVFVGTLVGWSSICLIGPASIDSSSLALGTGWRAGTQNLGRLSLISLVATLMTILGLLAGVVITLAMGFGVVHLSGSFENGVFDVSLPLSLMISLLGGMIMGLACLFINCLSYGPYFSAWQQLKSCEIGQVHL